MRSTIGMLFGSAGASMERECDVPADTWMVRLCVAELGSMSSKQEEPRSARSDGAERRPMPYRCRERVAD